MEKPVKGQKLYRFWGNNLEVGTFMEESIADGASVPTWLVRFTHSKFGIRVSRCSPDTWFLSDKEAIAFELEQTKASVKAARKALLSARKYLAFETARVKELKEMLISIS